MKHPLQSLLFAPKHLPSILDRSKSIAIREGARDYRANKPVILCCHLQNWAIMADVVSVSIALLKNVSSEDIIADGFKDTDDALNNLKMHYPTMDLNSEVTVIRWDNCRGSMYPNQKD